MGKYIVSEAKKGFKFNLHASNGQIIGSSEVYSGKSACLNGVEGVRKAAPAANLEDQTVGQTAVNPKFEVYQDKAGEYRFRLKARNGEIILVSEGYKTKRSCLNGVDSVRRNADSPVVEK